MNNLNQRYNDLKENFQKIPETIGSLIEITPEIREILGSLYKTNVIYAKKIEIIGENTFRITCKFPKYELSMEEIDHVSNVQMQVAFNQALYCCIGLSIRQLGAKSPLSYETFFLNRKEAIYRHDERTFTKKLGEGEESHLTVQVEPIIKKGNIYSITTNFLRGNENFMHGKVECLLEDEYIR